MEIILTYILKLAVVALLVHWLTSDERKRLKIVEDKLEQNSQIVANLRQSLNMMLSNAKKEYNKDIELVLKADRSTKEYNLCIHENGKIMVNYFYGTIELDKVILRAMELRELKEKLCCKKKK